MDSTGNQSYTVHIPILWIIRLILGRSPISASMPARFTVHLSINAGEEYYARGNQNLFTSEGNAHLLIIQDSRALFNPIYKNRNQNLLITCREL